MTIDPEPNRGALPTGAPSGQTPDAVWPRLFTFAEPASPFFLDCGVALSQVTIAYETWGQLNERRDNAILILTGFSADAHAARHTDAEDETPGWWDTMIGPGKSFDTDRWYVICSNVLGGCDGSTGPASTDPATGAPYGPAFPPVTIRDMVRAQRKLVDHLGVASLASIAGASLGGQQALEWLSTYPELIRSAIPIACSAKLTAQALAISEVSRAAILADPNFRGGDFYDGEPPARGLAVARMAAHMTYVSAESLEMEFGRTRTQTEAALQRGMNFDVQAHLRGEGQRFADRFDANTFLTLSLALEEFDLAHRASSLVAAFSGVRCPVQLISFTTDWLFPSHQLVQIHEALLKNGVDVRHDDVETPFGHDAFLTDWEKIAPIVARFLSRL
ncbi:MAG: homoserine O-acetyltransferase [Capsulimonadaceae bacterium]|nr:homoserine O-acetyltransferase [Capsulimonadaceae bacterium]